MSEAPLALFEGENGTVVEVFDLTRPYAYKNIFHVRLNAVARFPGEKETFERVLEKMGVFEEDLERTKADLVDSFKRTGLPYLLRGDFVKSLKAAQNAKKPKAAGY